jgi:hypothetical protein
LPGVVSTHSTIDEGLTWWSIVAHSKVWWNASASVGETRAGAVDSGTTNRLGSSPDDLGEVTVRFKGRVKIGRIGLAIVGGCEVVDFAIVKELGDDHANLARRRTCSNVLSVATATSTTVNVNKALQQATDLRVVGIFARGANLLGNAGQIIVPNQVWSTVVLTMNVVVVQDELLVR